MFRELYKNAYDKVTPSPELVADTISKARAGGRVSVRHRFAVRSSLAAAAAVLCLVMAVHFSCDRGPSCADREELHQQGDHDAGGSHRYRGK